MVFNLINLTPQSQWRALKKSAELHDYADFDMITQILSVILSV